MLQIRVGKKSHQDPGVQFIADTSGPDRATKTQDYDLLRVRVGQKEPPRPGRTICYGYAWARRSHQEPGVRFVTDKSRPERTTNTREYDLLRKKSHSLCRRSILQAPAQKDTSVASQLAANS